MKYPNVVDTCHEAQNLIDKYCSDAHVEILKHSFPYCLHERDTYISYHQEKESSLYDESSSTMYNSPIMDIYNGLVCVSEV